MLPAHRQKEASWHVSYLSAGTIPVASTFGCATIEEQRNLHSYNHLEKRWSSMKESPAPKASGAAPSIEQLDDKSDAVAHLVGTPQLLQHALVAKPTIVNALVPTPSIYRDDRGEIHNILAGNKRINVLHTKAGVMRSGDIHPNTQHDFVFEGEVEVWILEKNGTTSKRIYRAYEYIRVPPFTPHVFRFLKDSVIAEWWEPEPFEAWFYTPYREIVDKSFSSLTKGKLVKLVDEDESRSKWSSLVLSAAVVGGVAGLFAGIMVGRQR